MPSVAELVAALPPENAAQMVRDAGDEQLRSIYESISRRPVPKGTFRRLGSLGGLQAKIGLAFAAHIIRSRFQTSEQRERSRAEAYLAVAVQMLETMGYLRGAIMKVGQLTANLPDIVPDEFTETLGQLHFQAPPMHFSLLRERVESELDGDLDDIFADFDTHAVAAASLGQVHRATLKSGQPVAVKIQYPGIARSIRSDLRNLSALAFPLRLGKGWTNLGQLLEEIRTVMGAETDYELEADNLRMARSLFSEDDQIVIPRVHDQWSTRRILTMDWIDGMNFDQFLESNPDQSQRNRFGRLMTRGLSRIYYRTRTLYADSHPGNLIFMNDGRLGLVDFGCMRRFNDEEWEYLRQADMAMGGDRETVVGHVKRGMELSQVELDNDELKDAAVSWCEWIWEPIITDREFDFSDPARYREGIDIFTRLGREFRPRSKPVNLFLIRVHLANNALLYRLKSRFNYCRLVAEERPATGWEPRKSRLA